jgi:glycosyltransferase involved in cell wall biosynthesis
MENISVITSRNPPPPCLAIVMPCFNEADNIQYMLDTIWGLLNELLAANVISSKSYILLVDDGSKDQTWSLAQEGSKKLDGRLKGIKLSKNFGHQSALLAGLHAASENCDIAISIDADLQQDPNAIKLFIKEYEAGADIVFGVRKDRNSDSSFKKWSANLFYTLMKMMGVNTIRNHADYRLLSKRALKALNLYTEPNIFLRAMCLELGLKTSTVSFDVQKRVYGKTKYSLTRMLTLALHGITSHSIAPLRMVTFFGMLVFSFSCIMSFYVLYQVFLVGNTVPGWASTIIPIYFIGGIQLLCLGIIGEYIAQIYSAVKNRPRWIIEESIE